METKFWLQDPKVLLHKDKLLEVWPYSHMNYNEKINATTKDQVFISPDFKIGNNEIIKKSIKNTIPKLRLELNLISEFILNH